MSEMSEVDKGFVACTIYRMQHWGMYPMNRKWTDMGNEYFPEFMNAWDELAKAQEKFDAELKKLIPFVPKDKIFECDES